MAQYVTPAEANVKVGDFFVSSWGYDQTNIDFYRVVGLTPKGVKLQAWKSAMASEQTGGGYTDALVPGDGPKTVTVLPEMDYILDPETQQYVNVFKDTGAIADYWSKQERGVVTPVKPEQKRLQAYGETPEKKAENVYISLTSYSSARRWSGSPAHATASGYGH